MIPFRFFRLAPCVGGRRLGRDAKLSFVMTDTRSIPLDADDGFFLAIKGESFDGHDFLQNAFNQGVRYFIVSSPDSLPQGYKGALVVSDTQKALLAIARWYRQHYAFPVVCVCGSNGKTTVRQMISCIMSEAYGDEGYAATRNNFNNHIGVPKTVLSFLPRHRSAVVEVGMNHPGEMPSLLAVAKPTISVITNTMREHMGFMGSLDQIAHENGFAYEMTDPRGVCVLNRDDPFFSIYQKRANLRRLITFGFSGQADVRGAFHATEKGMMIRFFYQGNVYSCFIPVLGKHNVLNAMAAFSAGLALKIAPHVICRGLSHFLPVNHRMNALVGHNGSLLINDVYNANPDSVIASINFLSSASRRLKVLVLGDMAEMGKFSIPFHQEIADYARSHGVSYLFCLGQYGPILAQRFGPNACFFSDPESLVKELKPRLAGDVITLVKGSRFMKMERVVSLLLSPPL